MKKLADLVEHQSFLYLDQNSSHTCSLQPVTKGGHRQGDRNPQVLTKGKLMWGWEWGAGVGEPGLPWCTFLTLPPSHNQRWASVACLPTSTRICPTWLDVACAGTGRTQTLEPDSSHWTLGCHFHLRWAHHLASVRLQVLKYKPGWSRFKTIQVKTPAQCPAALATSVNVILTHMWMYSIIHSPVGLAGAILWAGIWNRPPINAVQLGKEEGSQVFWPQSHWDRPGFSIVPATSNITCQHLSPQATAWLRHQK